LYEDDGVTANYQGGAFSTTRFTCNATSGITIGIGAAQGSYAGQLTSRTYILKVNKRASDPGTVVRDGIAMSRHATKADFDAAAEGWFYDAAADVVWVKLGTPTSTATNVAF